MSLNAAERARTQAELAANLERSGRTVADVAGDLGWSRRHVEATLSVDGAGDPADVWLLRDYLDKAVLVAGEEPVAYTVLTEAARSSAERWFGLAEAPDPSPS